MILDSLIGYTNMPAGCRRALDMIEDKEVKKAVLYVRAELVKMRNEGSSSKYLDAFDMILTSLKEEMGTPDDEIEEALAEGLDEMSRLATHYDPVLKRHLERMK